MHAASGLPEVDQPDPRARSPARSSRGRPETIAVGELGRERGPRRRAAARRRQRRRRTGIRRRATCTSAPPRFPRPAERAGRRRRPRPPASTCSSRLAEPQQQPRAEQPAERVHGARQPAPAARGRMPTSRAVAGSRATRSALGGVVGAESRRAARRGRRRAAGAAPAGRAAISSRSRATLGRIAGQPDVPASPARLRSSRAPSSCPHPVAPSTSSAPCDAARARRRLTLLGRAGRRARRG